MADEQAVPANIESSEAGPADAEPRDDIRIAKPDPPDSTRDGPDPAQVEDDVGRRNEAYYTTINGLYAGSVTVGGRPVGRPRRSRRISAAEVHQATRFFHVPTGFDTARDRLKDYNMVVLCGPEDSGRRCAALRLLDIGQCPAADPDHDVELLDPGTSLDTLLDRSFIRGQRYLLADFLWESDIHADQLRFDAENLQRRVRELDIFLVITTTSETRHFGPCAVPWVACPTSEVFAAYLTTTGRDMSAEADEALRRTAATLPLQGLADLIDVLEKDGPEATCAAFGTRPRAQLSKWLDCDPRPTVPRLVPVVTAALLPGVVENEHERRATALLMAIDMQVERTRSDAEYSDHLTPCRNTRNVEAVCREFGGAGSGVWIVRPVDNLSSEAILAELHVRYGDELWGAVRKWLQAQPENSNQRTVQALAEGVVALRKADLPLAQGALDEWAAGTDEHRWAAAVANSVLCADDSTVPVALRQAVRWSVGSRSEKITAAYCFGLGLSWTETGQAVSRLWNLTLGDAVVAVFARSQLVASVRAAADDSKQLRHVLAIAERRLMDVLSALPDGHKAISAVLTTTTRILGVRIRKVPVTVHALRVDREHAFWLGNMWAQLVRSWQHRAPALDELHEIFSELDAHLGVELAEVISANLSPTEWRWLRRDLGLHLEVSNDRAGVTT